MEAMSYYEKWAASIATITMERGIVQQKELDKYLGVDTDEPQVRQVPQPVM